MTQGIGEDAGENFSPVGGVQLDATTLKTDGCHQPSLTPPVAQCITVSQGAGSFPCRAPPCTLHPTLLNSDMVVRLTSAYQV